MTREEIEKFNESEPYSFETDREEQWYKIGLKEGLETANNNPKWIDIEEDLPCNNHNDIHFGFTNYVLAIDEDKNIFIAFMRKDKNDKWVWCSDDDYDLSYRIITHWMPIPKLPEIKMNNYKIILNYETF